MNFYREPGSWLLITHWITVRLVWGEGRMGYDYKWRHLSRISTRFKIVRTFTEDF